MGKVAIGDCIKWDIKLYPINKLGFAGPSGTFGQLPCIWANGLETFIVGVVFYFGT